MSDGSEPAPWAKIPKLIVFDLDFTLWYPEMYELAGAPFRRNKAGVVTARDGEEVHLFDHVHAVLNEIATAPAFASTEVAVASSTTYPHWARDCMGLIHVRTDEAKKPKGKKPPSPRVLHSFIDYQAIYPKNKQVHFKQLHEESGVAYEDMLFFDNEHYNIVNVQRLGVVCAYCPDGLTLAVWKEGMERFQTKAALDDTSDY
ncbi:magnesium-dependent phosphatase-1 [Saprolegnia parasitica CBS 223.65]|uniref:Magnesium-dependent phosphatase-1 n=1 Tax=Saprolegnia parasitica (strain CBS 223.65) TaxID=695850 RepID=A0A067CUN7_SAPPC|nr:magnesium-dependent phosphatase-1 [Saprolegnia parasitica CBS 223.65]KDO30221.1 magnesium-dependent phosphatase-1 [Saprolegnia parasitica CBS 223.65]|eukprot:XP_012199032.1 magnesium-dependent phosphatase-1 [Saprolegnia parasitica CBS 223.65]